MDTERFKASELSSRKLWQLLNGQDAATIGERELTEVVDELSRRRRHLQRLRELGKLGVHSTN
ncbi:MAG: hypothetical protein U5K56_06180 [Halioglobus sp.]|nr:hypothetical protein [Halioglobus sp.]